MMRNRKKVGDPTALHGLPSMSGGYTLAINACA